MRLGVALLGHRHPKYADSARFLRAPCASSFQARRTCIGKHTVARDLTMHDGTRLHTRIRPSLKPLLLSIVSLWSLGGALLVTHAVLGRRPIATPRLAIVATPLALATAATHLMP